MNCLKWLKKLKGKGFYGLHAICFQEWFQVPDFIEFIDLDPKKSKGYSKDHAYIKETKDSFYHGKYRKYSAQLASIQYILKVQEKEFPDLPLVEYVCNKTASLLGLNAPKYYLIKYPQGSGSMAFVTKNFMQDYVGAFHHIYKFLPKGKDNYNCENIIKAIKKQTNQLKDVKKFIEICLFDAFIGNNDRHGRNLGIIDTGKNQKLAPMYDNPSYFGIAEDAMLLYQFNISGSIWTAQSKKPKLLDYVQEFKRLQYEESGLKFIKKIIKQFPLIKEEIKQSGMSEKRKKAFMVFLEQRLRDCKKTVSGEL